MRNQHLVPHHAGRASVVVSKANPASFLVERLGTYPSFDAVCKAIAAAYCGERLTAPPVARSRNTRIEMAMQDAFFPTGHELAAGLRILAAIEMLTQTRGNDFVEVNQHAALASFNVLTQTYSLAQALRRSPAQCCMVICGPLSMLLEKLMYALRSILGPIHRHHDVVHPDGQDGMVAMPSDLVQIPLLVVKMPVRTTEGGLYFAVLEALSPFVARDLLHKEGLSRRKLDSYVPTLVRGLLALHVGAIAIVGMRKAHLQAAHLPQFYLALEWLKASGIGVVICTAPGMLAQKRGDLSPLYCATEAATFVDSYDDRDLANLAQHWYALLERDEPQPSCLVEAIDAVHAQREAIFMIFRELHQRLHVERMSMAKATANIAADACAARKRQHELWDMDIVPYTDGHAYRDWLPFDTVIEEPPPPKTRR
ncbi:hypothetical protein [Cupriavidus metallidurans]|uniref:hypothetical protein n=1 Tax=Cupriavidus metallidurans TaxID=119219 RepID=UPI001CCC39F2|nr:hypothetical protein [Cupriavidus metallidurans]UBM09394.1 hypothetical protein LAI70_05740 [Cupriavidus metallidurans]